MGLFTLLQEGLGLGRVLKKFLTFQIVFIKLCNICILWEKRTYKTTDCFLVFFFLNIFSREQKLWKKKIFRIKIFKLVKLSRFLWKLLMVQKPQKGIKAPHKLEETGSNRYSHKKLRCGSYFWNLKCRIFLTFQLKNYEILSEL